MTDEEKEEVPEEHPFSQRITVNLRGIGDFIFTTAEDVDRWAIKEREAWGGSLEILRKEGNPHDAIGMMDDQIKAARILNEAATKYMTPFPNTLPGRLEKTITDTLRGFTEERSLIPAFSPEGTEIRETIEQIPEVGAKLYLEARDADPTASPRTKLREIIRSGLAEQMRRLDTDNLRGAVKTLTENTADLSSKIENMKKDYDRDLESIKAAYLDKEILKAPSDFWSEKAVRHLGLADSNFKLFCWAASGLISAAIVYGLFIAFIVLPAGETASNGFSLTPIVIFTVPALAAFWMLRLISRKYVTNLALAADAEQRGVMMQTYLALLVTKSKDGNETAMTEDQRLLVLNALFRPVTSSGGDDDAPPSNLLDILKTKKDE